jgi:hypothetical protein
MGALVTVSNATFFKQLDSHVTVTRTSTRVEYICSIHFIPEMPNK